MKHNVCFLIFLAFVCVCNIDLFNSKALKPTLLTHSKREKSKIEHPLPLWITFRNFSTYIHIVCDIELLLPVYSRRCKVKRKILKLATFSAKGYKKPLSKLLFPKCTTFLKREGQNIINFRKSLSPTKIVECRTINLVTYWADSMLSNFL